MKLASGIIALIGLILISIMLIPKPIKPIPITQDITFPITLQTNDKPTFAEFYNYTCSFCQTQHKAIFPSIAPTFSISYVPLPFYNQLSKEQDDLHKGSICVAQHYDNQTFYKYHDKAFQTQKYQNSLPNNVDKELINKCITDPKTQDIVNQIYQLAKTLKITKTPTVIYNNNIYVGAIPAKSWQEIMEEK
jgi:protein-disulfide isomerase